jgi:Na+-translocating ferredoxin:NAD+ oxidoreductase RNF subunit RnfB
MFTRLQAFELIKQLKRVPRTLAGTYALEYLESGESPTTIIWFVNERFNTIHPALKLILEQTADTTMCRKCGRECNEDEILGYKNICHSCNAGNCENCHKPLDDCTCIADAQLPGAPMEHKQSQDFMPLCEDDNIPF